MIINPQLATAVRQAWINDQEDPRFIREKRKYPDAERFAELLDVAFRASLKEEEGRPVRGSLTWLSPEELATLEMPKRRESPLTLRLNEPRPLDPEIIAKLATATSPGTSSLLVGEFDGVSKVWGIIYYDGENSLPLTGVPAGIPEVRHFSPDAPTIGITGTGSITVTRANQVIGRIEKGEFREAALTPFHAPEMISRLDALFSIKTDNRLVREANESKVNCLQYLLFLIDMRGGGATVVFVPDAFNSSLGTIADFPWRIEGKLELEELMRTRVRYHMEEEASGDTPTFYPVFDLKVQEALRHRLSWIARLASLDGAVLLTPTFEIIGFGVKLRTPDFAGHVKQGVNAFGVGGGLMDFSRFGTRHNSALRFVAAVPGAVAFVASTDGPIRGLAKTGYETASCWPDCRLSMFA